MHPLHNTDKKKCPFAGAGFPQGADHAPGGTLDCADWRPREDLFPNGLPYLTQQGEGGIPLLLYSWGFVPPADGNVMNNFTWITSGREAMVQLNETYAFYSMIRDRFLAFNGTSFEEDNTDSWTTQWAQSMVGVDTASTWWMGFATPWCEAGIPVQACESTASDLLEALKYGCITSSRDTIDDVPGAGGNSNPLVPGGGNAVNFLHRWRVGQDRLLMASINIHPFFDNVWSTMWQNSSTWAGFAEYYVELAWILSVLSGGAVGFSDMPYNSNRTLIMTACKEDGALLGASLPSYYLDDVYRPKGSVPGLDPTVGRVYQAPSFIPSTPTHARRVEAARARAGGFDASPITGICTAASPESCGAAAAAAYGTFTTVLAIDMNSTAAQLAPWQLTPDLSAGGAYVAVPWSRGAAATAAACAPGAPPTPCTLPFSPTSPLPLFTGAPATNYTHDFELYSISPLFSSGWALLGELDKVVRVSPARFAWVAGDGEGLRFEVTGSSGMGEEVVVTLLQPGGNGAVVLPLALSLPPTGACVVTCAQNCTWECPT